MPRQASLDVPGALHHIKEILNELGRCERGIKAEAWRKELTRFAGNGQDAWLG